jgi:hypothetical protein
MGERSSICCVGARSTLHEQQTHQKLGRAVLLQLWATPKMARFQPNRRSSQNSPSTTSGE